MPALMKTTDFQRMALEEIREELTRGEVPFGQIQALARGILELSRSYPAELDEVALKPLLAEFPEMARVLLAPLKRADQEKSRRALEELRGKFSS